MIEWHQWYYDNCVCIFVRESGKFPLVCGGDDYLVMLHRDDVTISFDRKKMNDICTENHTLRLNYE